MYPISTNNLKIYQCTSVLIYSELHSHHTIYEFDFVYVVKHSVKCDIISKHF